MKLATLRRGGRDGMLVVVDRALTRAVAVPEIAGTMQAALDEWERCAPALRGTADALAAGEVEGFALEMDELAAPLPRAYQWADGSAYLSHVERVRQARGAEMPWHLWHEPLIYQGASDPMLAWNDPVEAASEEQGIDFEAEIGVVLNDVPMGVASIDAPRHVALLVLVNDISLRNLVPRELEKGFGFFQSKPASALSPVAVTPDELGRSWRDARVHRPLCSWRNGEPFGWPEAGEGMVFSFGMLIAHAARTRRLGAGTIVGSGTVSNRDPSRGTNCIVERRCLERIELGEPKTPYLRFGDRVRIEMTDDAGASIFGAIDQRVVRYER